MKIMLDECITQGPANALIQFFSLEHPPVEAHFAVNYFGKQGTKDHQIADKLQKEGGWSVITADRGKKHKNMHKRQVDGPPMHEILPTKGISAVYLSGPLQQSPGAEKARAIISVWPEIKQLFESSQPGSSMLLSKYASGFALRSF